MYSTYFSIFLSSLTTVFECCFHEILDLFEFSEDISNFFALVSVE